MADRVKLTEAQAEDFIVIRRFHSEAAQRTRSKARRVLRKMIAENPDYRTLALDADCIIEQVWNALVGNDKIKFPPLEPKRGRVWRNKRRPAGRALLASSGKTGK